MANSVSINVKDSKYATGRRKKSIAKIWLQKGSGQILVNGKKYDEYFKRANHKMILLRPFEIINQPTNYDVVCKVKGGGLTGQARALRLAISRSLEKINPELRSILKKAGMLTRDARVVERKKYGQRNNTCNK